MARDKGSHPTGRNGRRFVHSLYDWVGTLVVALCVFALLFAFAVRIITVDGSSMLPSFQDGDRLLLSVTDTHYERGDVVVVDRYTDEPLIKRVIAVGGDTLSIDADGRVFINGKYVYEGYIQGETILRDFSGEVKVPQGYLFIMGDNRTTSKDSRSAEIGLVSVKDVVGKAIFRVWPMQSFGKI